MVKRRLTPFEEMVRQKITVSDSARVKGVRGVRVPKEGLLDRSLRGPIKVRDR